MSIPDLVRGAIDLHVHSSPDVDRRRYDDIELAREAARAGMGAVLIKSHQNSTVERASLVSKIVPEIRVFGGLVLNRTVGGFNLDAVRLALRLGARQIWMPTRDALNHRRYFGETGGLTVFDQEGHLSLPVRQIIEAISESDCILGTGHLGQEETFALVEQASRAGVRHILITHPEWAPTFYSSALQRQLAAFPGVMFERCFVSTTHLCGFVPFEAIGEATVDVGIDRTILSTDLGQPDTPAPVDGLRIYAERLRAYGFSEDQLRQMMALNPARLLSLESVSGKCQHED